MSRWQTLPGMTSVRSSAETLSILADDHTDYSGRQVFEILVRDHADMLVSYLRSLVRVPDVVDDLFQETMLTAWRRLPDYDRDRPFGPWLRGIATRLALKHRERRARDMLNCDSAVLEALEHRFAGLSRSPDGFGDAVDRLLFCLRRLPDKIRVAVELVYRQGLGLRQVATRLGASEEAVKKRVQRGRRLLAECVQGQEVST